MIYCICLLPILMILIGYLMYKYPPKKINRIIGYRTSSSMKNNQAWKLSNQICGKLWIKLGLIMLLIACFIFLLDNLKILYFTDTIISVIVFLEIIPMILSIFIVEHRLNNNSYKMKKWLKIILAIVTTVVLLVVIDLACIFTIHRPLFAIQAKQPYTYTGLFYNVYYCPEYSLPQIKLKGTKFCCAVGMVEEEVESKYTPIDVNNVSISISDISLTGATVTIEDINEEPYVYGQWYKIEKCVDGRWYEIKPSINNYGFNEIGYLPNQNNEVIFVINWKSLYGELTSGNYRILKQVNNQYIAVEFYID